MKLTIKILVLAVVAVWSAVFALPDNNLHVVVCDVGQGDAILVSRGTTQMLVDGGPDNRVMDCLAKHMPFYDRRIEMVVLTHPQADHMDGLIDVVKRYGVLQFVRVPIRNNTSGFRELIKSFAAIGQLAVYSGDQIKLGGFDFKIIWPTRQFVETHDDKTTDLNSFAIVGRVEYGGFEALLTGDADSGVVLAEMATGLITPVEVLKVPHHGSKTGMLPEWLRLVDPQMAIISVGKNNRYGHPTKEALELLAKFTDKVYRTDQIGTVEIIFDGKKWWVKTSK